MFSPSFNRSLWSSESYGKKEKLTLSSHLSLSLSRLRDHVLLFFLIVTCLLLGLTRLDAFQSMIILTLLIEREREREVDRICISSLVMTASAICMLPFLYFSNFSFCVSRVPRSLHFQMWCEQKSKKCFPRDQCRVINHSSEPLLAI
jgi:hypothetical protein